MALHCLKELSVLRYLDLALELGLKKTDVERVEQDHPRNSSRVLQEIISLWMDKSDPKHEPSWKFLKSVLEKMELNSIASTI